jgi:hypothetical protein
MVSAFPMIGTERTYQKPFELSPNHGLAFRRRNFGFDKPGFHPAIEGIRPVLENLQRGGHSYRDALDSRYRVFVQIEK